MHANSHEQRKAHWHAREKYQALATAKLLGGNKVSVIQAVRMQDHEVLAHLLQCGADPNVYAYNTSAVEIAMQNDDSSSLKLLIKAGAHIYGQIHIDKMSAETFKYLIDQGIRERDPWHGQSYIRTLFRNHNAESKKIAGDNRNLILKAMLAINSGAIANPYMANGCCLLDDCSYRRKLEYNFPNLIHYLSAAETLDFAKKSGRDMHKCQECTKIAAAFIKARKHLSKVFYF